MSTQMQIPRAHKLGSLVKNKCAKLQRVNIGNLAGFPASKLMGVRGKRTRELGELRSVGAQRIFGFLFPFWLYLASLYGNEPCLIAKRRDFVVVKGTSAAFAGNFKRTMFTAMFPVTCKPGERRFLRLLAGNGSKPRVGTLVKKACSRMQIQKVANHFATGCFFAGNVPLFTATVKSRLLSQSKGECYATS